MVLVSSRVLLMPTGVYLEGCSLRVEGWGFLCLRPSSPLMGLLETALGLAHGNRFPHREGV